MVCSHVVHATAAMFGACSGNTAMNKVQHVKLKREIETMCNLMQPGGVISFVWDGHAAGNGSQKLTRYTCTVGWSRRVSLLDRSPSSYFGPKKVEYISLVESHTYAPVKHFWEPFQREPRFAIQVLVLQNLVKICCDTMARRYGPNWREKTLLKAQGADIALDEKRAYGVLHTMGGPAGGGEWIHVPAGCEAPEPHMRFPPYSGPAAVEAPVDRCQYEIDEPETGYGRTDEMDDMEHFMMLKRRVTNNGRLLPDADGCYRRSSSSRGAYRTSSVLSDPRRSHSQHSRANRTARTESSYSSSLANGEGPRPKKTRHDRGPKHSAAEKQKSRRDDNYSIKEDSPKNAAIERE
ncbi:transcription elongation factor b polypeptide 3 isoform x2 [Diplodia corticola]|uniref:Transcription elongation factor b polypeptide 3 isoform x2 n=1 Tax=Diplodia corticola TaxID=236234 RepID=A0A1J9RH82_9PEZI|nr:transcription elongation factor b polypeptide 3 isoform x2 [Diplodia corticola]OJD39777.1 transcription elongation factor b polypeptide 3 isoform x2 [Diplodia corticola]